MPSALEDTIEEFNAKLAANDNAISRQLAKIYEQVVEDLKKEIALFEKEMARKYGPDAVLSAQDLLREQRYQSILLQYQAATDTYYQAATGVIQGSVVDAVELAVLQAKEFAELSGFTSSFGFDNVPTGAINSLTGAISSGPLQELIDGTGSQEAAQALRNALLSGLARGINPRDTAQIISDEIKMPLGRAETIARTETMRALRSGMQMVYNANDDILQGWMWNAAKSERTCAACLALDGKVFPMGVQMNSHPRCRCVATPVLLDESLNIKSETGEEWLRKQKKEVKEEVLGSEETRKLFDSKRLSLDDYLRPYKSTKWGDHFTSGGPAYALRKAGINLDE